MTISESKPGINRGNFNIPAAKQGDFEILHVLDSFFDQPMVGVNRPLRVPQPGEDIARSVVMDFCNTVIESSPEAHPGLGWVVGKLSKAEILSKHKAKIDDITAKQLNWFRKLIQEADAIYEKHRDARLLSDLHRKAADYLKIERNWNKDYSSVVQFKDCPSCHKPIHPDTVRCPECHAILNKEKAKEYGLA